MIIPVKTIEDAMIASLKPLTAGQGGPLATLDVHPGRLGDGGAWDSLIVCPAVMVGLMESNIGSAHAPLYVRELVFAVRHVSSHLASESDRRREAMELAEMTSERLNGSALGLSIEKLAAAREFFESAPEGFDVFTVEYKTSYLEDAEQYQA